MTGKIYIHLNRDSLQIQTFCAFFDELPQPGSCFRVLHFSGVLIEGSFTKTQIVATLATKVFLLSMKKWVKVK